MRKKIKRYKMLKEGDKIKENDEWEDRIFKSGWHKITCTGIRILGGRYRRPIKAKRVNTKRKSRRAK